LQGAVISAAAATVGSSLAFGFAKLQTPVRKKALDLLDEYPSLRGIERVVAKDGLKAILTLRLAPILPIPIGLYNYVYGVTNVPYTDFAMGIFLGSIKPYLLDSYLGVFGKNIVEGDSSSGFQDVLLLGVLGLSVLIGVFASQLAGETWESVSKEIEAEKLKRQELEGDTDKNDDVTRVIMGMDLPNWIITAQYALKEADVRVRNIILEEYEAQVWNFTKADGGPPPERDPAVSLTSIETLSAKQGFDFGAATADGIILSPLLFQTFLKYADPLYEEDGDEVLVVKRLDEGSELAVVADIPQGDRTDLLTRLDSLRSLARARIESLDLQSRS
jgi:hypothetical protein